MIIFLIIVAVIAILAIMAYRYIEKKVNEFELGNTATSTNSMAKMGATNSPTGTCDTVGPMICPDPWGAGVRKAYLTCDSSYNVVSGGYGPAGCFVECNDPSDVINEKLFICGPSDITQPSDEASGGEAIRNNGLVDIQCHVDTYAYEECGGKGVGSCNNGMCMCLSDPDMTGAGCKTKIDASCKVDADCGFGTCYEGKCYCGVKTPFLPPNSSVPGAVENSLWIPANGKRCGACIDGYGPGPNHPDPTGAISCGLKKFTTPIPRIATCHKYSTGEPPKDEQNKLCSAMYGDSVYKTWCPYDKTSSNGQEMVQCPGAYDPAERSAVCQVNTYYADPSYNPNVTSSLYLYSPVCTNYNDVNNVPGFNSYPNPNLNIFR